MSDKKRKQVQCKS